MWLPRSSVWLLGGCYVVARGLLANKECSQNVGKCSGRILSKL